MVHTHEDTFVLTVIDFPLSSSMKGMAGVSRRTEDANPTSAPGAYSWFWWSTSRLFNFFVCFWI